jgi:hypothetical protein
MTYQDFLTQLNNDGISRGISTYQIVNDDCVVIFTTGMNQCEVKALEREVDPLEGNAMILYLERDIELRYYEDQFDVNDFVVSK